jgi:hypothetical protein
MLNTTANSVLNELGPYALKQEAPGEYRCNRPWSNDSNSMGLTVKIDGAEHGTYHDHVSGQGGSLYDLAERLGITPNGKQPPTVSKRGYKDLADYAQAHGVDAEVFKFAGWIETTYQERPALLFKTATGNRWRFLDGDSKLANFKSEKGYKSTWYKLDEAIDLAEVTGKPLVICNGEPSVVTAQYYQIPATAVTGGEHEKMPTHLLDALTQKWAADILITPDCDETGYKMGTGFAKQLTDNGYAVRVVDLQGGKGYDLADFCKLYQNKAPEQLGQLPNLEQQQTDAQNISMVIKTAAHALRPREPQVWLIDGLFKPKSVNALVGAFGIGKTYAMLSMGVKIALGADFLNMVTKQCTVFFLDEESGEERFEIRLADVLRGEFGNENTPIYYTNMEGFNLRSQDGQEKLHQAILMTGAELVIIDAMVDIMPGADENSVKDTHPVFMALRRIAEATGACIVLIHHTNKLGDFRGSTAIGGAVDVMLMIDSKTGSNHFEFFTKKNRDGEPMRFAAMAHWSDGQFWLTPDDVKSNKVISKSKEYVMRILTEKGEMSLPDIESNADICSGKAARSAVYALAKEDVIYRTNPGEYGRGIVARYALKPGGENDD